MIQVCCWPMMDAIANGKIRFLPTNLAGTDLIACLEGANLERMEICPYCGAKLDIKIEVKKNDRS